MQPFAFSESIPGVLDIDPMFGIDAMLDIGAILDIGAVEVICVELSIGDISVVVISADMRDPPMSMLDPLTSTLFFIPAILIEEVSEHIEEDPLSPEDELLSPRPGPALRM